MGRLADRTTLITGAAGGIGAATARLFTGEGANVVVCDLDETACRDVAKDIGSAALAMPLDVTSEANWQSVIDRSVEHFGRVDVVMNCAGVFDGSTIEETTVETFDRLCAVNLKGVFLGCKYAIPVMEKQGGGVIDRQFVAQHTSGWPEFEAKIREIDWADIERVSGHRHEDIAEVGESV